MTPRWKKLGGDVVENQGRLLMMLIAIAAGVFTVAAIATAYAVLSREIDKNYLAANPPTALLDVEPLDDAAVSGVRRQDGIAWADASGRLSGRIEVAPRQWLPLLLFVVPNFAAQHIGTVELTQGRWPDKAGELVIERTAMTLARAAIGRELHMESPNGSAQRIVVTGVVHDPSLAPAAQQQVVYGYVTPATLKKLGDDIAPGSLNISVLPSEDRRTVEQTVVHAALWLKRSGYRVGEIRMPPRHHPHWSVMRSIVRVLLAFSVLTLILSALLSATLTASLLSPQIRQIAIMKAIGARTGQIMVLYLSLIAAMGVMAVAIGLPTGIQAGRGLASFVAHNQNIDLSSRSIPAWMYLAITAGGIALPLLLALVPIAIATGRQVNESLIDFGAQTPASTPGRWTSSLFHRFPILTLALRNSVRRRARLALNVVLLAVAGALFITSLDMLAAWKQSLVAARAERPYDIEIQLRDARPAEALKAAVGRIPGVRTVEAFDDEAAALRRDDGLIVTRTFPDGEHGSLRLAALPADSAFIGPHLIAGHWLTAAEAGTVINQQALSLFPAAQIGDFLNLTVRGRPLQLHLAGIIREHLAGATMYLTSDEYGRRFGRGGFTRGLRLDLEDRSEDSEIRTMAAIELLLEGRGVKIANSSSQSQLGRALAGHLFILIFTLIMMSILMALVGIFGIGSAMATGVLERRRELAILRALGAGHAAVLLTVLCEGLFVGFLSAIAAAVWSAPVTMLVASLVGTAMLGSWQGVIVSATAIPIWLAVVLTCATLASGYPAHRAAKMTIREALTHQ